MNNTYESDVAENTTITERPIRLRNNSCIYCFVEFDAGVESNLEHVIGKNFVPSGSIRANDWNLIARACKVCNNAKSKLENEVSAITLQPDLGVPCTNTLLRDLAQRKAAKVRSGFSNRLVQDSIESAQYNGLLARDASVKLEMVAPPQLNQQTMRRLASFHVSAFFYLITFNEKIGRGERLPGGIIWIEGTRKSDWGNRKFRTFADLTTGWRTRILGTAAEGYFRISIKREPQLRVVWSFGLEWNRCLRMIGFFGDHREAAPIIAGLPEHDWHVMDASERYREEVPLADEEDSLFG